MNVTRDVVIDLLSLVRAGEASEDTRALVESRLKDDPELARIADERSARIAAGSPPPPREREMEMRTLERTRKWLTWRSAMVGAGVFFALFPVYFTAGSSGMHWLPLESPLGAAASAVLAFAFWAVFFWMRSRFGAPRR